MLSELDVNTLVDLILARAKMDKTEPDSANLRNGWRTDALLTDVDLLVTGQHNDPAAYASIAKQILGQIYHLPDISPGIPELIQLAILRGERLLPITPQREQAILKLAHEIDQAITALPEGPKKMRCRSLMDYHMGIFCDAIGRFDLAVVSHEKSAKKAKEFGDLPGASISIFVAALYRLKQALLENQPDEELEALFSDLEEKFGQMEEALRGSALYVQWAQGNGPMHMIMAHVWLGKGYSPFWGDWVTTAIKAADKLGEAWKAGAELVEAANNFDYDGITKTEKSLTIIAENEKFGDEVRATAFLLLTRLAAFWKDVDRAQHLVESMPKTGAASHVKAVAERLLKQ